MIFFPARRISAAVLTLFLAFLAALPVHAATAGADLAGTVTRNGVGISHATVILVGKSTSHPHDSG